MQEVQNKKQPCSDDDWHLESADMQMTERLRIAREAKGWTQVELAKRSGVLQATISGIETGLNKTTRAETLFLLADALGVSARWLATGEGSMFDGKSDALTEITAALDKLPPDKLAAVLAIVKTLI